MLADEIEAGNVRALLVIGGDPLTSLPDTGRLERAFSQLDVLAVADVVEAEAPEAHRAAVRRWAGAVWADWSDQHDFIRGWAQQG